MKEMVEVTDFRSLISGYGWIRQDATQKPVFLTYSFDSVAPAYLYTEKIMGTSSFQPLNEAEKATVRAALNDWASVSGITFFETQKNQGDITFGFYDFARLASPSDAAGQAMFPVPISYADGQVSRLYSENLTGGDVFLSASYRQSPVFAEDLKHLALHEIGHALGLKHPFETSPGHDETLSPSIDNGTRSVMSYQEPRMDRLGDLDRAAIQHLYGDATKDGTQVASFNWNAASETLTQAGTAAADVLRGTGASDVIYSMGGADLISTAQGRDRIVLVGQAAEVNGGSGTDTVVTGIAAFDRSIISTFGDDHTVRLANGQTQVLRDVERLAFGDATVAFDTAGSAGQIYRLYQAAFDRTPDRGGITFNLANYENRNFSMKDMANFFVMSPEFTTLYGANSSDTVFINAMYSNVLNRAPDAGGLAFYQNLLSSGTGDRAHVLAGFSESPENIALVAPSIVGGIMLDSHLLLA